MNKQEIEAKINELKENKRGYIAFLNHNKKNIENCENELADLQAELDKCGKRWRAKEGEEYWRIDGVGYPWREIEENDELDVFNYNIGNYFHTEAGAEAYKKALELVQECEAYELKSKYYYSNDPENTYQVSMFYRFPTLAQAEEFAEALKLVLKVKENEYDY